VGGLLGEEELELVDAAADDQTEVAASVVLGGSYVEGA